MATQTMRWTRWTKRDRRLIWGIRSGEWWIGARRNFQADAIEVNVFGLTLLVGARIR